MQLAWLEDFVELARTRNFSRAAENRFVTSPAFGRRIRALEEWVGAPLAERKQPVSLTPAGMLQQAGRWRKHFFLTGVNPSTAVSVHSWCLSAPAARRRGSCACRPAMSICC